MRLRRGLLLAGIHLGIALPLLAWNASVRLATGGAYAAWPKPVVHAAMLQEADRSGNVAGGLGPCRRRFVGERLAVDERLISSANLPASIFAGWFDPCPAPWTVSRMVDPEGRYGTRIAVELIGAYAVLIVVQWILVGAFPLIRPDKWWREPGAFITVCFAAGAFPLLAADAVGAWRWARSGAHAPMVSHELILAFSDVMAIFMVLAWSGWALVFVTKGLNRMRSVLRRRGTSYS